MPTKQYWDKSTNSFQIGEVVYDLAAGIDLLPEPSIDQVRALQAEWLDKAAVYDAAGLSWSATHTNQFFTLVKEMTNPRRRAAAQEKHLAAVMATLAPKVSPPSLSPAETPPAPLAQAASVAQEAQREFFVFD